MSKWRWTWKSCLDRFEDRLQRARNDAAMRHFVSVLIVRGDRRLLADAGLDGQGRPDRPQSCKEKPVYRGQPVAEWARRYG
ncbi:hypothetical protein [Mycoplana rhizolycopersici]|uniref:Uncharacterized protein n=1 Tax=Mycoplana rhizolycopersici TaxID=2746702 RepID=A0ABX2Q7C8_9HYPH|nr:hypothetical protein [Rhizobium rhizolycopersici]NVP53630.1 hypothetical protein [Rhizobium rhizolycopersici]